MTQRKLDNISDRGVNELHIDRLSIRGPRQGNTQRLRAEIEAHLSRLLAANPETLTGRSGWSFQERLVPQELPPASTGSPERLASAIHASLKSGCR